MNRTNSLTMQVLMLCGLAAGCASSGTPESAPHPGLPGVKAWAQAVHSTLLSKYTPVNEWSQDDPYIDHSGLVPFEGDCDDYFTAAWNRLNSNGLRPFALIMRKRSNHELGHIVACTRTDSGESVCLDPSYERVVTQDFYTTRYTDFVVRQ